MPRDLPPIAAILLGFALVGLAAPAAQAAPGPRLVIGVEQAAPGVVRLTAIVRDAKGAAATQVPVTVKGRATFGWLVLARASTDAQGRAAADIRQELAAEEIVVEAEADVPLTASIRLGRREEAQIHPVRPGTEVLGRFAHQPGLISPSPSPALVSLLALLLGGVWATYAYVVGLLTGIRRERVPDPAAWMDLRQP